MVKHTQTIRQQFADELFECVWPFCEIAAQRVKTLWLLFPNDDAYMKFVIDWWSGVNIKSIKVDLWFGRECVSVKTCWCKNAAWAAVKNLL